MEMRFLFSPKKLSDKLPTKLEILQAFLFEKQKWMINQSTKKEPPNSVVASIIREQIQKIYSNAGIENLLSKDRIKAKIIAIYKSRLDLLRIPRSKRYILSEKVKKLKSSLSMLLDVTCTKKLSESNELPLKNLLHKLDGATTSDKTLSGPIGKAITKIVNPPIVRFKKFDGVELLALPDKVYTKLSNDQKYLFRIVNALISGEFTQSLQQLKVGPYNQSRWLTSGSRICLLYASTEKPSETLKILTSYVVNVYAPTWFQIKKNELAIDGPKNLFFLISKIKLIQNVKAQAIVKKCIQRNAFFANSENVLLAQLVSKNKVERYIAVHKILKIRKMPVTKGVRRFKVPQINYAATSWTNVAVSDPNDTEPPFTLNMKEDELKNIIQNPLQVPMYKCHTQMVERAVKEVTRVSSNVIDPKKRSSMVKATLLHRAKYPKLDSAKDFMNRDHDRKFLPKI